MLPVLAAEPSWTSVGVEFVIGRQLVKVEGEVDRLRAVLDACNGRTTVRELFATHGEESGEVIEELLRVGALTDAEQAWRRFHRWTSNPTPFLRTVPEDEVFGLMRETFRPSMPLGEALPLAENPTDVGRIARRRRSGRVEPVERPLSWEQLSALLSSAYGRADSSWLTVPSGGALYPTVVHVLLRKALGPLSPGIWWYDPWRDRIHEQRSGPPPIEPLMISHEVTDPLLARGEPMIALSVDLRRSSRKYGPFAYRLALMEVGAVMQTAYLVGTELDIPVRACAGFHDPEVASLLDLPDGVVSVLLLYAGA
jgi:SagB-type dehydrogenase family enzyme